MFVCRCLRVKKGRHAAERRRDEGGVSKYSRKTYKTPTQSLLCSGAHSKCTHVKDDCLEGRSVIKVGKTDVHKTAEAKGN